MADRKRGYGKYQEKINVRIDPRELELFEKRYRFLEKKEPCQKQKICHK